MSFSQSLLRSRGNGIASVSFSELLFDLIYVFAVTQISHYLLHHLTWLGFLQSAVIWFAMWMAWQHTTWMTNWFDPNTRKIRIFLFILMLIGLIIAAAIPVHLEIGGSYLPCVILLLKSDVRVLFFSCLARSII